ncbi:hypothetical protein [Leyella stercorea]|uniref:hypothetical protein n=1 Tax=Leyella stercorea TaxID=363265 RepID=UPI002671AB7E|nr:hypothetical protein [Leyella stercorea]
MKKKYLGKTIGSLLIVLLMMPLGHALMILMEHFLEPTTLHYSAFLMGFVGLVITIAGVFVKGDTRQTCFGLAGALLFWTGWVEFLFAYFAQRFGVHCDLVGNGVVQTMTEYVNGVGVNHTFTIDGTPLEEFSRADLKAIRGSRPEYLIMPATFGMWMMFVVMYTFCTRTGCLFIRWVQRRCGINEKVELRPMAYHPSIVMFMEWNIMMWGLYMLLMFCYDPVFLGDHHPVTYAVAAICLFGSALMFKKQLYIKSWGRNLRMAYATVIVFWTFVEVVARNGLFKEIWVDPMNHVVEMSAVLAIFVVSIGGALVSSAPTKQELHQ